MMPAFKHIVTAFALAVSLTACNSESGATRVPEAGALPVTLSHRFGSTTIQKVPQRVVTVGYVDQDAFLALGIVPVATLKWFGNAPGGVFPWAQSQLGEHPAPKELSKPIVYSEIASLKPDLISALYADLKPEEYEALSAIAPTVVAPAEFGSWGMPWQEITRFTGRVVGRPHEAEELIAGVDRAFDSARKSHPEFAKHTVAVVSSYGWPESYYALAHLDGRVRFFAGLGFESPSEFDTLAAEQFGVPVKRAQLSLADRDLVVWLAETPAEQTSIQTDPDWQKTRAFREGRSLYLPSDGAYYAALNFSSILSLPYALAGLVPAIQAAIDGDPAAP